MNISSIVNWLIQSTWFKKYSGVIGGFCLGLWVSTNYWRQIREILHTLNISKNEYNNTLLIIVGAAGITTSIVLSLVKNRKIKKQNTNNNSVTSPVTEGK